MLNRIRIALLCAISLLLTSASLHTANAQSPKKTEKKEITIPLTNLCKNSFFDPFVSTDLTDCIVSKSVPIKIESKQSEQPKPPSIISKVYAESIVPTSTSLPTSTPTQASTPPDQVSTPTVTDPDATSSASLNAEVLFNLVNSYRVQVGLEPFSKDTTICEIANSRAPELYNEIFGTSYMHAGFRERANSLNYWATENMIYQNTEQQALNWWLNSPIHRSAILGDYKYSCTACSGKSCCQIFTSFAPKVI